MVTTAPLPGAVVHTGCMTALDQARQRIAARPPAPRILAHLEDHYGISVSGLTRLDLGVYRAERRDGPEWAVRIFPAVRPAAATAGDAEILGFLAEQDFGSERAAAAEPLSVIDGQTMLVTEFVAAGPRSERAAAIRAAGGLRRLGEMLGQLASMPADGGALARPGGCWHHLADGSPAEEIEAARALLAEREEAARPADRDGYEALWTAISDVDGGDGLPESLIHPDFVLANVIDSRDRGMVVVDWAGAGRGPRLWPLAFLLYAEAAKDVRRIGRVIDGYRGQVALEPEELARLAPMMLARPVVLAVWSRCLGRIGLEEATRAVAMHRAVVDAAAPYARALLSA
jgi:Ser/Thr protein kinase RdoA (MazF antagonist)